VKICGEKFGDPQSLRRFVTSDILPHPFYKKLYVKYILCDEIQINVYEIAKINYLFKYCFHWETYRKNIFGDPWQISPVLLLLIMEATKPLITK
jgi:hypothetical protein